jgi:hypothetical protein
MKNYPGILQVEEFAVVRDVFKEITSEPWFPSDEDRRAKFGRYVIHAYQSGITDKGKLYDTCARTAQNQFAVQ